MRLGLDGVIWKYDMRGCDARMWTLRKKGDADALRELFNRFLLMGPGRADSGTDLYICANAGLKLPSWGEGGEGMHFSTDGPRDRIPIRGVDAVPDRCRRIKRRHLISNT
jgi:hypothetical protein